MYGAILGDIIGSPFEFNRGDKTKEFDLFSKGLDCQHFFRQIFLGYFPGIVQVFDIPRGSVK